MRLLVFRALFASTLLTLMFSLACSSSSNSTGSSTAASVTFSPTTLNFSNQAAWSASAPQTITLTNSGTETLTIASITSTGDFSSTNTCGSSVAAGANCTISVTFTPSTEGAHSGSLNVSDNTATGTDTAALSGTGVPPTPVQTAGCTETGNKIFPSCFALSSPTQLASASASKGARNRRARKNDASGVVLTAFSADTAQIAALLTGTDPNPAQTIGTLGNSMMQAALVAAPPGFCFNPGLFYANHPEASEGNFPASGQMPGGGLWTPTDSNGQACAAAELNLLTTGTSSYTQVGLAIAAEMSYMAGANLPTTAGGSYDETAAVNAALQAAGSAAGPFQSVQQVTVYYDGTSYSYQIQFAAADFGTNYQGYVQLIQTPGNDQYTYSGVLQFGIDDGTILTAATVRYQRTSQTNIDISARSTHYPEGTTPTLLTDGQLDPSDPNWIQGFSRFAASFDPTSQYLTGNYVYAMQGNAPNTAGPQGGQAWVFQVAQNADGTGAAFYGMSDVNTRIDQPTVWQIDHISCLHMGSVDGSHLYAQYQPFEFDATGNQYVPSLTIARQIRYAPTSTCQWTDAQWNGGTDPSSFWYDRTLTDANITPGTPVSVPSPVPQFVVADGTDSSYPFSLFGDDQTVVQTLISQQGFVLPALF